MALRTKTPYVPPAEQAAKLAAEGLSFLDHAEDKLTASIDILADVHTNADAVIAAAQAQQQSAAKAISEHSNVLANLRALRQPPVVVEPSNVLFPTDA